VLVDINKVAIKRYPHRMHCLQPLCRPAAAADESGVCKGPSKVAVAIGDLAGRSLSVKPQITRTSSDPLNENKAIQLNGEEKTPNHELSL
jgi:hypothetical protein